MTCLERARVRGYRTYPLLAEIDTLTACLTYEKFSDPVEITQSKYPQVTPATVRPIRSEVWSV